MSWPFSPPSVLQNNFKIHDGCSLVVPRLMSIGLGNKLIIGLGSNLRIL